MSHARSKVETRAQATTGVCKWQDGKVPLGRKRTARADILINREECAAYPDRLSFSAPGYGRKHPTRARRLCDPCGVVVARDYRRRLPHGEETAEARAVNEH